MVRSVRKADVRDRRSERLQMLPLRHQTKSALWTRLECIEHRAETRTVRDPLLG